MNLAKAHRYVFQPLKDMAANMRHVNGDKRILAIRDIGDRPDWYADFLRWLAEEHPQVRSRFELKLLGSPIRDWTPYALCLPWVQDPVKERCTPLYDKLKTLEAACDTKGIPVVNRVDALSNSVKTRSAEMLAEAGCRAARAVPVSPNTVDNTAGTLGYPFFIRENLRHQGPTFMVEVQDDITHIPWSRFAHPIAVEFIDTRSPDGMFRKYRYLLSGDFGCLLHLMISEDWEVRQNVEIQSAKTQAEHVKVLQEPCPFEEEFQNLRRLMGFDFCAFDYSVTANGDLVVWEANPYPQLPLIKSLHHRMQFMKRGYAVMAAGYLQAAGFEIPQSLMNCLPKKAAAA